MLVARGDKILLHKGYGFADLALEAPAKDETVYHIVGPMLPFTGHCGDAAGGARQAVAGR